DKNASEDEIKKAYRKRALMHHPDFDPNSIFKAFFGGPGGFSFEASGPGNFFFQFG
ncbi:DNAJC7 isoform 22, partial [Pan troglodytes]